MTREPAISTILITPVILSGGAGTRLWPLSRSKKPKQLLALTAEQTLIQLTAGRCTDAARFGPPIIVTNELHADAVTSQLEGHAPAAIILEPVGRNTAPAIALAAFEAAPSAPLLVMPSDHVIEDVDAFHCAIEAALPLVEAGWMVTFGITPHHPETGFGYIQQGEEIAPGVRKVNAFVEKPDRATAEQYLASGEYFWNAGIFLFRADTYLAAIERHVPAIGVATRASLDKAARDGVLIRPDAESFLASPSDSIDYAVMEKDDRVAVAPVDMGWSDIGSWDALHALGAGDAGSNVISGDVIAMDTTNCLIRSEGPVVTAVGVHDLIVIATKDAVMILPRGDSQQVKRIVEELKTRGHPTLHDPF